MEGRKEKASGSEKPKAQKYDQFEALQHNGAEQSEQGAISATDFLTQLRPGGPWLLVAIDPDRDRDSITAITAHQQAEASSFIERWNGKRNLYYTVNPIR